MTERWSSIIPACQAAPYHSGQAWRNWSDSTFCTYTCSSTFYHHFFDGMDGLKSFLPSDFTYGISGKITKNWGTENSVLIWGKLWNVRKMTIKSVGYISKTRNYLKKKKKKRWSQVMRYTDFELLSTLPTENEPQVTVPGKLLQILWRWVQYFRLVIFSLSTKTTPWWQDD